MKTSISHFSPFTGLSCQQRFHGTAVIRGIVLATLLAGATSAFCATTTFVQRDTTTQGTWIHTATGAKIYGSEGYLMMGSNYAILAALPGYVSSLTFPGFWHNIWREPGVAIAPRDLQIPVAPYTARIAAGWYYWPGFTPDNTIFLTFTDNEPHLMAMYFEDADSTIRRQRIEIRDDVGDALLDSQNLDTPFDQGVWLQWKITGNVRIKVILTDDTNTAHMGFFFDPDPGVAYMNWLARFSFATGVNMMPAGDVDRDGMSNQQEFAFGLNPTLASSVNPITAPLAASTGKFTYTRFATSGLTYSVLTSTDLVAWNPAAATQSVTGTIDQVETVEVTLTDPPPAGGKLFVRVQATKP